MKIALFLTCWLSLFSTDLEIVERFFSFRRTFDAIENGKIIATATEEFPSLTPTYTLCDANDVLLARGKSHLFSWGMIADIEDADGSKLGRIEEELFSFFPWVEFRIYDAQDVQIATAQMDLLGTRLEIFSPDHLYATVNRSLFQLFREHWTVQIFQPMDLRLLILLAVLGIH